MLHHHQNWFDDNFWICCPDPINEREIACWGDNNEPLQNPENDNMRCVVSQESLFKWMNTTDIKTSQSCDHWWWLWIVCIAKSTFREWRLCPPPQNLVGACSCHLQVLVSHARDLVTSNNNGGCAWRFYNIFFLFFQVSDVCELTSTMK